MNWYVYARSNPLKYVDPDGLEILPAQGMTAEQRIYFNKAVAYLNQDPWAETVMHMLHRNDAKIFVHFVNGDANDPRYGNRYTDTLDSKDGNGHVYWNSDYALKVDGDRDGEYDELMSSVMALFHEFGHAHRDLFFGVQRKDLVGPDYDSLRRTEEQLVVDQYETPVAASLGLPTRDLYHNNRGAVKYSDPIWE